jgi:predicted transglutaminase-like cysteine proteinase
VNSAWNYGLLMRLRWGLIVLAFVSGMVNATGFGVTLSDAAIQRAGQKYGKTAIKRLTAWQKLMQDNKDKDVLEKLRLVNDFFNLYVKYVSDQKHWKTKDYWATPLETLGTQGGDCEDYAIAKYLTLREMGLDDGNLRITYVKYRKRNTGYEEAHMVLSYYESFNKEPYILDNINKQLLKASLRKDLIPVYSFNADGLWVSKGGGAGQKAGSSSRIKAWNKVRDKLASQASTSKASPGG